MIPDGLSVSLYLQKLLGRFFSSTHLIAVVRIRMDPGFFADPDPGFKSPDPSMNKLIGSKLWF